MEFLKEWIMWAWLWIHDLVWSIAEPLLTEVVEALPEEVVPLVQSVAYFYSLLNSWLPMDEYFLLWSSYIAFVSTITSIKWVLKLIPGIG